MTIGMNKVIKIFDLYMYVHTGQRSTSTCIIALRLSKQNYIYLHFSVSLSMIKLRIDFVLKDGRPNSLLQ